MELAAPAGSAYRTGPDGAYSDARFLQVLERTFYKDGLPADGVMHLTAAELAFAELGVRLHPPAYRICRPEDACPRVRDACAPLTNSPAAQQMRGLPEREALFLRAGVLDRLHEESQLPKGRQHGPCGPQGL